MKDKIWLHWLLSWTKNKKGGFCNTTQDTLFLISHRTNFKKRNPVISVRDNEATNGVQYRGIRDTFNIEQFFIRHQGVGQFMDPAQNI